MNRLPISCHLLHTDTTNVSVYGDYESEEEEAIDITFGVPKNGRWNLKQFVLSLIVNQQGIPFFMNLILGMLRTKSLAWKPSNPLNQV